MKIYELLATPDKWTKGVYGLDKNGVICHWTAKINDCVSFSLAGAIHSCYKNVIEASEIKERLNNELKQSYIEWSDAPERTHAEVLELVTRLGV